MVVPGLLRVWNANCTTAVTAEAEPGVHFRAMPLGKRRPHRSISFTSWISPEEEELLQAIAERRLEKKDGRGRKPDALHWLLGLPIVKRYAETGKWH